MGLPCGHGATTTHKDGRPFGPKSKAWNNLCKSYQVNPETGEVLPESFLWEQSNELLIFWLNVVDLPSKEAL
jgi:hypothetical protein